MKSPAQRYQRVTYFQRRYRNETPLQQGKVAIRQVFEFQLPVTAPVAPFSLVTVHILLASDLTRVTGPYSARKLAPAPSLIASWSRQTSCIHTPDASLALSSTRLYWSLSCQGADAHHVELLLQCNRDLVCNTTGQRESCLEKDG